MINVLELSSLVYSVTVSQYDWYIGCPVSQPSCPSSSLQLTRAPRARTIINYNILGAGAAAALLSIT